MADKLPEPLLQVQTIDKERLPASSYRFRGQPYARFQPFEVFGEVDIYGNNQLNWTNLFLIKKLGQKKLSAADVDVISELSSINDASAETLKRIKELAQKMSDEYAELKEKLLLIKTLADLQKIKDSLSEFLNDSDVAGKVALVEAKLSKMEKLLKLIAVHVGAM